MTKQTRLLVQLVLTIACAIALVEALTGCSTAPITGRKELSLVGESTMNQLGQQQYTQALAQAKEDGDAAHQAQVKRVAGRLADAAEHEFHPGYKWEFHVIDDQKTANAWCLPGGRIAVYSGIL